MRPPARPSPSCFTIWPPTPTWCGPCRRKSMPASREMYSNSLVLCCSVTFLFLFFIKKAGIWCFPSRLQLHTRTWCGCSTWTWWFWSRCAWFPPRLGSRGCAKKPSSSTASPSLKEPSLGFLWPCYTRIHVFGAHLNSSDPRGKCSSCTRLTRRRKIARFLLDCETISWQM